ncbi:MAG: hypothetical protein IJ012_02935 [Clostridia bacterium]|nr:hypothetical protein [Clostridia bacterium]
MGKLEDALQEQRLYEATLEKKAKAERRLGRAKKGAFRQAINLFVFPFRKGAFAALFEAIVVLLCTIIFSGVATPVLIAVIFCAVVDLLALLLYIPVFPFAWLILAATKAARVARLEKTLAQTEKELSKFDPKAIAEEIGHLKKNTTTAPSASGVETTEWYKRKVEEHYDTYMGYAPRERKYKTSDEELEKFNDIVENQ